MDEVYAKLEDAALSMERNPALIKSLSRPLHHKVTLIWKRV
jgi:hypothetical protein